MRAFAHKQLLRRDAARATGIRKHAARLLLGEITPNEFLRVTADDWLRLARTLHNAYRDKLPDSLGVEDLAQEMQLEAFRVLPGWKPGLRSVGDYLIYNGCSKARKTLNKERGAEGRDGKKPSRFPIPASRLARKSADGEDRRTVFDRQSVDADQEQRLIGRELYRELKRELGRTTIRRIEALREGGDAAREAIRASPALVAAIERMREGDAEI